MSSRRIVVVCFLLCLTYVFCERRVSCAGNMLLDESFEVGFETNSYCRPDTDALAVEDVRFCTVGYSWNNALVNPYPGDNWSPTWIGPNVQSNLMTSNTWSPNWFSTGEIDVITAQFQPIGSGIFGVRLSGQTSGGSVHQNFDITSDTGSLNVPRICDISWVANSNRLSTIYPSFRTSYYVNISSVDINGVATVISSDLRFAPTFIPGSNPSLDSIVARSFPVGRHRISFISNDSPTGVPGAGAEFYAFTGAIIDDVCVQCVASSPSPSPSASISQSPSASPGCPCCSRCVQPSCAPLACPPPSSCPNYPPCPEYHHCVPQAPTCGKKNYQHIV